MTYPNRRVNIAISAIVVLAGERNWSVDNIRDNMVLVEAKLRNDAYKHFTLLLLPSKPMSL